MRVPRSTVLPTPVIPVRIALSGYSSAPVPAAQGPPIRGAGGKGAQPAGAGGAARAPAPAPTATAAVSTADRASPASPGDPPRGRRRPTATGPAPSSESG